MKARLTHLARRDLVQAARWMARDNPTSAEALLQPVDRASVRIAAYPLAGVARPDLAKAPFRFLFLTDFPYAIVYDPQRTPPVILRILHSARDIPSALQPQ